MRFNSEVTLSSATVMRKFNFVEFHNNIQKDFAVADSIVSDIEKWEWSEMHSEEQTFNDEKEFDEEKLADILEEVKLKTDFAHEYLGLPKMAERFEADLKEFKGKFGTLGYLQLMQKRKKKKSAQPKR